MTIVNSNASEWKSFTPEGSDPSLSHHDAWRPEVEKAIKKFGLTPDKYARILKEFSNEIRMVCGCNDATFAAHAIYDDLINLYMRDKDQFVKRIRADKDVKRTIGASNWNLAVERSGGETITPMLLMFLLGACWEDVTREVEIIENGPQSFRIDTRQFPSSQHCCKFYFRLIGFSNDEKID